MGSQSTPPAALLLGVPRPHHHGSTPGSSKGGHAPCVIEHVGRRGKPVLRQRFIPAEKAFVFANKLQGKPGCTV